MNFVFISPHFPTCFYNFCKELKNLGWNVLGIGDAPYYELSEECKASLTEYYLCFDMNNFDNEVNAVRYFENKYGHIDFLESNNEYWLEKDARLREIFNITTGADTKEVLKFKQKSVQKEYFMKANLKPARWCLPKTRDEVVAFSKIVGFPMFGKPDNGVGAQGTIKIENEDDIDKFMSLKGNSSYILEEFVDGDLVSFDGISNNEGDVLFATQNVFFVPASDIVSGNLDDSYYTNPYPDKHFLEVGKSIVKAFNLKNRFFHIEIFILKDDHPYLGKKGTLVPLEGNMRPAGGFTPDIINFANSLNCYKIYAESVTFNKTNEDLNKEKYYCISVSRRLNYNYINSNEVILQTFKDNIVKYGEFPYAIRDDMGDLYYIAKFKTLKEAQAFDVFVRSKEKKYD